MSPHRARQGAQQLASHPRVQWTHKQSIINLMNIKNHIRLTVNYSCYLILKWHITLIKC